MATQKLSSKYFPFSFHLIMWVEHVFSWGMKDKMRNDSHQHYKLNVK